MGPRPASGGEATGNAVKIFSGSSNAAFPAVLRVSVCVGLLSSDGQKCVYLFFLVFGALWRMSHAAWNKLQHALHGNGDSRRDAEDVRRGLVRAREEAPDEEESQPRRSARVRRPPVDVGDAQAQLASSRSAFTHVVPAAGVSRQACATSSPAERKRGRRPHRRGAQVAAMQAT